MLGGAIGLAVVACAGRSGGPVGTSDGKGTTGGRLLAASDGGFVDGAGSLPLGYRQTFAKINKARFVSLGHASGRWEVDVWGNDAAVAALATRAKEVPVGAVVVEEHFERNDTRSAGPVMVMEKRAAGFSKDHGDWRYAVVGSQGQLVQDGVVEQCAGCHDDAPMDGLFPLTD